MVAPLASLVPGARHPPVAAPQVAECAEANRRCPGARREGGRRGGWPSDQDRGGEATADEEADRGEP
ncbi:unnamed protein product [Urochloa humidicola]